MINFKQKLLISSMLLAGAAMNTQAGIMNYSLPGVSNSISSGSIVNWFSTSVINDEIDSFALTLSWKDQGWGNRKGRIYYRSGNSGWLNLGLLAEHFSTTDSKTIFSNAASDFDPGTLDFGYVVGGGGGHKLFIRPGASLSVTTVPEPTSLALLGLGVVGLGLSRRMAKA